MHHVLCITMNLIKWFDLLLIQVGGRSTVTYSPPPPPKHLVNEGRWASGHVQLSAGVLSTSLYMYMHECDIVILGLAKTAAAVKLHCSASCVSVFFLLYQKQNAMETNTHPECYIYMMDQGSHVTASIVGSIYSAYQCDAANHSVYVLGGVYMRVSKIQIILYLFFFLQGILTTSWIDLEILFCCIFVVPFSITYVNRMFHTDKFRPSSL